MTAGPRNRSRAAPWALATLALLTTAPPVAAQNVQGFVFGSDTGAPLQGVLVRLLSRTLDPIDSVRTDLLGRFSFQAEGPERYVIVAEKAGYGAAPQIIEVSAIALAKVGVTIEMKPMGTATVSENPSGARTAYIRGRVVDVDGNEPVEGAEVTELTSGKKVLTRYDGRFFIGDVPPGPVRVRVEHIAYTTREWAVEAEPGTAYDALIPVEEEAIPLEGIEVTVRSRAVAKKLEPVFERMERNLGGIYLDAADFKRRGYPTVGAAIQGLPSVRAYQAGYRWLFRFRRGASQFDPGCAPDVWLDGVRVVRAGQPLDEFLSLNTVEVEVVELFPSPSSIPAEYSSGALCAIGIWTKRGG